MWASQRIEKKKKTVQTVGTCVGSVFQDQQKGHKYPVGTQ